MTGLHLGVEPLSVVADGRLLQSRGPKRAEIPSSQSQPAFPHRLLSGPSQLNGASVATPTSLAGLEPKTGANKVDRASADGSNEMGELAPSIN